jgi:hypothetical protein
MDAQTLPAANTVTVGPLARRLPQGRLRLGPFLVDAEGRLTPAEFLRPPGFRFAWRGLALRAELVDGGLSVRTLLGRVPSTLGSADLRPPAFEAVNDLPAALPSPWRMRLMPDHHLALDWSLAVEQPVSAIDLLTGLTRFLLELGPYLDVLAESGLEEAGLEEAGLEGWEPGTARI